MSAESVVKTLEGLFGPDIEVLYGKSPYGQRQLLAVIHKKDDWAIEFGGYSWPDPEIHIENFLFTLANNAEALNSDNLRRLERVLNEED